ncbi:hypothetical protein KSP40_PGU011334 [Platanthera guangdongensis]|uniref:WD repeat-containing protein WRAP73 n=1 Tax=Platanthera guangdongensis TaxID=2320717 RepID=A0ABR2LMZ6_9ASPA
MDFTDSYKQTGPCCFSPDSRYLAIAVDYRLVIRDLDSLKVVQLYSCVDKISYIEWASDSEYILCGLYRRPMVQAWSLTQPEWTCKIDEGPAGIAYARWSPDSRHILTTSEFQLRLTVWSLVNTACVHVQWPKHTSRGVCFTKDGRFAAICTRRDCKDYINLLSCHSWDIMGTFAVDTIDLAGVEWSPDDSALVTWDSLLEYKDWRGRGHCPFGGATVARIPPRDNGISAKMPARGSVRSKMSIDYALGTLGAGNDWPPVVRGPREY